MGAKSGGGDVVSGHVHPPDASVAGGRRLSNENAGSGVDLVIIGHGESGGRFEDGTIGRWLEESIAVIDAGTLEITTYVPVGESPSGVAVTPDVI